MSKCDYCMTADAEHGYAKCEKCLFREAAPEVRFLHEWLSQLAAVVQATRAEVQIIGSNNSKTFIEMTQIDNRLTKLAIATGELSNSCVAMAERIAAPKAKGE